HIRYGTTASAMAITSKYGVQVAGLDVQAARVTADTRAAFVQAGGQDLREIVAKAGYAPGEGTVDVTAADETRSGGARGPAFLPRGAREVDVRELSFRSGNVTWATAPGSTGRIRYDGRQVAIEQLALVNGDQRIDAAGTVALKKTDLSTVPAGSLNVKAQ